MRPWNSTAIIDRAVVVGPVSLRLVWRRTDGIMGRFGGGWNYSLGLEMGSYAIVVNLLIMFLIIRWGRRT